MTALLALVVAADVVVLAHGAWARRHDPLTTDDRDGDSDDGDQADELLQVVPDGAPAETG